MSMSSTDLSGQGAQGTGARPKERKYNRHVWCMSTWFQINERPTGYR